MPTKASHVALESQPFTVICSEGPAGLPQPMASSSRASGGTAIVKLVPERTTRPFFAKSLVLPPFWLALGRRDPRPVQ